MTPERNTTQPELLRSWSRDPDVAIAWAGWWDPLQRNPLRLQLQSINLRQKFFVSTVKVLVNDDHVEIMAVCLLHLSSLLDYRL